MIIIKNKSEESVISIIRNNIEEYTPPKKVKIQKDKTITITENGKDTFYPDNGYDGIGKVIVDVESGVTVEGDISITSNGVYDVSTYATATVNVPDTNGSYNEGYGAGIQEGYNAGYELGKEDGTTAGRYQILDEQSDADITTGDVLLGKIGYGKNNTRVVGTVNLTDIRENAYDNGYNKGYNDRTDDYNEILSDATITPSTVLKGYIGYGANATQIIGEYEPTSGGDGYDFSVIGYTSTENENLNNTIEEDIAYSKTLYDAWNPSNTSAEELYYEDTKLVYAPAIDTSNVTDISNLFYKCSSLIYIPHLNTSNVKKMSSSFYQCSALQYIPHIDTSKVTTMASLFNGCSSLTILPQLNTSNVTIMSMSFLNCTSLTSFPELNTSKVTTMYSMLRGCKSLIYIPQLNTSNVTNMEQLFYDCTSLTSFPELNTSKVTTMYNMLSGCSSLTSIPELDCSSITSTSAPLGYTTLSKLTDLGGFKNLKASWSSNFLDRVPNATHQSLLNVINGLYDLTANGLSGKTVKFGSTNLAKLTADEIAIATNKGWTLT